MATIKDIAKKCNVSIATVSNILNGKGSPSEATKKKVFQAADELNYVPNFLAKNLKQRSTKMIGVIAEDLTVFNCPEIIDGINEMVDQEGYTFILGNLRLYKKFGNKFYTYDFEEYYPGVDEEFRIMNAKNVEGIIYVGAHCREIQAIKDQYNVPVVVAYGYTKSQQIPSILFDDERGAYDVTNYLLGKNAAKVGVLAGDEHSMHTSARLKGFQQALFDQGVLYNPEFLVYGDWKRSESEMAVKKLIEKGVTSIFAMNDEMAMGVYDYAYKNDISIGQDIHLVGFDNREIADVVKPGLTSVSLPLHKMGMEAAQVLISMIEKKDYELDYKISCDLVIR